ncbi:hypothetical protein [Streptomyces sp. NBC_01190]|uniref:effector-associated constant component EACC1 n=1 Tax=Streptomyces sp. NBC_01190 TaxID=2903767 RepID=UPI003869AC05|nr:hypothetical protein OG519_14885 [Streptomyces sp. NBC_01190]
MQVEIRATNEDGVPALYDFFRWLRDDQDGPGDVRLANAAAGRPGAMGALEVIQVVLSQSTAMVSLAMQYVSWRHSRGGGRHGAEFTFARASDGLTVAVQGGTDDDVRRMLALLAVPPEPPSSADQSSQAPE